MVLARIMRIDEDLERTIGEIRRRVVPEVVTFKNVHFLGSRVQPLTLDNKGGGVVQFYRSFPQHIGSNSGALD